MFLVLPLGLVNCQLQCMRRASNSVVRAERRTSCHFRWEAVLWAHDLLVVVVQSPCIGEQGSHINALLMLDALSVTMQPTASCLTHLSESTS